MARKTSAKSPAGETLEAFLEEQGIRDEVYDHAIKAVVAWRLAEEMKRQKLSKAALAQRLGTSRTEIYRVLDPQNDAVSLGTLKKAAAALGKRLRLDLVDAGQPARSGRKRVPGAFKGRIALDPSFFEPSPEDELKRSE